MNLFIIGFILFMKKLLIALFFFLFFSFSFFSSGVIDSQDGFQYLAVARNIYYKGEPTAPVYEYDKAKNAHMSTYVGRNGKTYSPTGLGFSIAMLPAVAITDIVYKIYGVLPPVHFPLENDWLILLTASFTNSFFGAFLGVVMFVYFYIIGLSKKQSLFMSLITLFTTNLFVYTKHSVAHMMFTSCLLLSFLNIKLYFKKNKKIFLFIAGLAFGVVIITYNLTFILTIPPLLLYFLLLLGKSKQKLVYAIINTILFLIGTFPFLLVFLWFEHTRAPAVQSLGSLIKEYGIYRALHVPVGVFIEGVYGQLISPGRSLFIYSPLLIIPILFWHKIKKSVLPELSAFVLLTITYVFFYSIQFSYGGSDRGYAAFWHGESSWGPRYLVVLIPFGMLVVGHIYRSISIRARLLIFLPLLIFGLYVEVLGVLMPYQIKYHDLEGRFFINGTEYTTFNYTNLLPRYSPIFMMSKNLVKLVRNFPKTLNHGEYNARFYDGIDFPFYVWPERWRTIESEGHISFDNNRNNPVKRISMGIINHPLNKMATQSAKLKFFLNGKEYNNKSQVIAITERKKIDLKIEGKILKDKGNKLTIVSDKKNPHLIGLLWFSINNKLINFETIDVPYVYSFAPKMVGAKYQTWGGINRDGWRLWELHTQIFERTPDFWWIKPLYYWDLPKNLFLFLFIINASGIFFSACLILKIYDKRKK